MGLLALLALAAVAFVVGSWLARLGGEGEVPRLEGPAAVLPVVVRSTDGWARWGLPALLGSTLERTPAVETVELDRLRSSLVRRDLLAATAAERERARRLAADLGARVVVDLTLGRESERVVLDVVLWSSDGPQLDRRRLEADDLAAAVDRVIVYLGDVFGGGARTVPLGEALSGDPWVDRLWATGVARRGETDDAAADAGCVYFRIASLEAPRFLEARRRRLRCLLAEGRDDAARTEALELIQRAQARGARDLQAAGFETLAALEEAKGNLSAARGQLEQAARLYDEHGDQAERARVLEAQGRLAAREPDAEAAIEALRAALDLRTTIGDRLGQTETLVRLGRVLLDAPTPREDVAAQREEAAAQALEQAATLAERLDDPWLARTAADALGDLSWRLGDAAGAAGHWRRALELYRGEEDRRRELSLLRRIAVAAETEGDLATAEDLSHEQADLAEDLGDRSAAADAAVRLTRLQLRLGYPKQARRHLDEALALDRWLDDRAELQRLIAWTAYERGSYGLAVATLERWIASAPARARVEDREFLDVYRRARAAGQRLPLPGEEGYAASVPASEAGPSPG